MTTEKNNLKVGDLVRYSQGYFDEVTEEIGIIIEINKSVYTPQNIHYLVHWIKKDQFWWANNGYLTEETIERLT